MVRSFTIGEKAKQIDQKKIGDRMKIRRKTIGKIIATIIIYFLTMGIFSFFL